MAYLDTVADYVAEARILLQDTISPYRYADADLYNALNIAQYEALKLRPDLFLTSDTVALTNYTAVDATVVPIDQRYRQAFVYFMCGLAQLRDEENTQDTRSAVFMQKFVAQLTGLS